MAALHGNMRKKEAVFTVERNLLVHKTGERLIQTDCKLISVIRIKNDCITHTAAAFTASLTGRGGYSRKIINLIIMD